jgi:THO complex subunit 2
LPLLDCNVGYNNELWPLLQPFPYSFRYALYGEWDVALTDRLNRAYSPAMALAAAQSAVNVRSTLRRVTSGNDRQAARALGKASTAAPTMLWSALLDQIKSYPNMIPSLAKAVSRYGSDLGWDVAMFMLLKTLSDPGRDRVKEDGLHAADWLQCE